MDVAVVTLFPELFEPFFSTSMVGRAVARGLVSVHVEPLRDHGLGKHRSVDDTPYGGGAGMVIRVDCAVAALEAVERARGGRRHRVLLSPAGAPHRQATARRLASLPALTLLCGRYEGFDERVREHVDEELSVGDFVLVGGEVAAMAVCESVIRLLPGVLGNAESTVEESFSSEAGGLEYPHYTRPVEFRGAGVPEVLKSGDHERIRRWRNERALERTAQRRPDLLGEET